MDPARHRTQLVPWCHRHRPGDRCRRRYGRLRAERVRRAGRLRGGVRGAVPRNILRLHGRGDQWSRRHVRDHEHLSTARPTDRHADVGQARRWRVGTSDPVDAHCGWSPDRDRSREHGRRSPAVVVRTGDYMLSESGGPSHYTAGGWSCTGGSLTGHTVAVTDGADVRCEITNTFQPPPPPTGTLTLAKNVENAGGGQATPDQWTLTAGGRQQTVSGSSDSPEVTGASVTIGGYHLSESDGPADYTAGLVDLHRRVAQRQHGHRRAACLGQVRDHEHLLTAALAAGRLNHAGQARQRRLSHARPVDADRGRPGNGRGARQLGIGQWRRRTHWGLHTLRVRRSLRLRREPVDLQR